MPKEPELGHHGHMLRLLPMLLILGLALVALIDCLARDQEDIRGLPKVVWVFVVLLFPLLGSLAWFFAGRPRATVAGGGVGGFRLPAPDRRRPVAPDDDPEFLRGLGERNRPTDEEGEQPGRAG